MGTTYLLPLLFASVLVAGCTHESGNTPIGAERAVESEQRAADEPIPRNSSTAPDDSIVGEFYYGDGLGMNLNLTITGDSTFACAWRGCLGSYGTCSGTWQRNDMEIQMSTLKSDGMFTDQPIGNLAIESNAGNIILIKLNDRELYDKLGPAKYTCFYRSK